MKGQASSRFIIVAVIASLVGSAIGIQMIRIQNIPAAAEILAQSENYRGFIETIYPERGNIYDVEGNLLAGNEATFEVGLDLASVAQPETIAAVASSVLGLDYAEVLASAQMTPGNGNPYYVVLEGFATKEEIDELEKINQEYEDRKVGRNETKPSLRGLIWTAQNKRSYPEGDLASNIIGFYSFLDKTEGKGILVSKKHITTCLLAHQNKFQKLRPGRNSHNRNRITRRELGAHDRPRYPSYDGKRAQRSHRLVWRGSWNNSGL